MPLYCDAGCISYSVTGPISQDQSHHHYCDTARNSMIAALCTRDTAKACTGLCLRKVPTSQKAGGSPTSQ